MTATGVLVSKELRGQAVLFGAIVAGILAGEVPDYLLRQFEPLIYLVGCLALGAASVGHEYRLGTMTQLLAQPVLRRRILAVKMGVLVALVAVLSAVGAVVVFPPIGRFRPADRDTFFALQVLPILYGLLVAPWLTIKTRSTLAGTLFSGALGALLVIAGDNIGAARGLSDAAIDVFKLNLVWGGSLLLCAVGAIGLWRSFERLEASDGPRAEVMLPSIFRTPSADAPAHRRPLLRLAAKELRLQQLTFVPSLIYVGIYLTIWARRGPSSPATADTAFIATMVHALIVAGMSGALSCAEERSLGTLEWQLLQPVAARVQFAVKVAVALCLALALGVGLPTLLAHLLHFGEPWTTASFTRVVILVISVVAGSMYLSSVVASAFTAMLLTVPVFMVMAFLLDFVWRLQRATFQQFHELPRGQSVRAFYASGNVTTRLWVLLVLVVLVLAFDNHRDAGRSPSRAFTQLAALTVAVLVTLVAFAAIGQLL